MPLCSDPGAIHRFVLPADRRLPAGQRPVFLLRLLTRRECRAYRRLGEDRAALAAMSDDQAATALLATLGEVLAPPGWDRLVFPPRHARAGEPVPFDPAGLDVLEDVLTESEMWQLYWGGAGELDESDLKNFDWPPSSAADGSAAAGAAGAAESRTTSSTAPSAPPAAASPGGPGAPPAGGPERSA